jgi:drug/metabolite transporter (DMT)-like permease
VKSPPNAQAAANAAANATATSRRLRGVAMLIAASVLWSLSGVVVKFAHAPPLAFAFYRSLAAAAAAAACLPLSTGRRPAAKPMIASAVLYTAVVALLIVAMTRGTAASGIFLQYTGPIFCAIFAVVFQHARLGRQTLIGLIIAVAGVTIMFAGTLSHKTAPPGAAASGTPIGPICGLASGAAFGALILVLRRVDHPDRPANALLILLLNNAAAALLLFAPAILTGAAQLRPWQIELILATGVVQLAAPYLLFQLGLRRVTPVDASLLILLEPVLNPIWVWLVVGEVPEWTTFIGGAAILATLIIEATKPEAAQTDARELGAVG